MAPPKMGDIKWRRGACSITDSPRCVRGLQAIEFRVILLLVGPHRAASYILVIISCLAAFYSISHLVSFTMRRVSCRLPRRAEEY